MILEEYDAERHISNEKQLSYEEGKAEGKAEGEKMGRADMLCLVDRMIKAGESEAVARLDEPQFYEEMRRKYNLQSESSNL
ncbi:MAG: hypothetical protein ACI4F3_04965 [Enterocloster sp.]